jgi:polysaccharide export outer membrane protein
VRGTGSEPKLIVFRKGDSGDDRLVVDENTELRPGDVIEIALQASLVPEANADH